jgi:hypothetical protein
MPEFGGRGSGIQLYGVIIRDKARSADLDTLLAYRTVARDLLAGAAGPEADDLRASLDELAQAITAKQSG